jgi:heptosyltransferase I
MLLRRPDLVTPDGPVLVPEEGLKRACIVLLSGIGDVVHGLPLALDMKERDPAVEVVWVAEAAPAEVLRFHPAVDRVIVFDSRSGVRGVRALRTAMADIDAQVTLNVQRYLKSVWPVLFSGAGVRVGLPRSKTRDGVSLSLTHALQDGPWKHTQDQFLDFRWALGVPRHAPVHWRVTLSETELAERDEILERFEGRPVACLVVASANPKKDWPAERYAELSDALSSDFGFRVLLLGGRTDRECRAIATVLERTRTLPVDASGDSVRRLMALVSGADLVVAPDTGPLHLAHALGVPVIGLFAHTNPWRVGPWRDFHDLVVDRYTEPGAEPDPSGYLPKDARMDSITLDDVLEKVEVARSRYL